MATNKYKYTKEQLEPIAKDSYSLAEVIRKLNLHWSGWLQYNIKKLIDFYDIDISHFLGQGANFGDGKKGGTPKKSWQEILIWNENATHREKAYKLRRALIESGRSYACETCGNSGIWNDKRLILQVDHCDGNWKDSRPHNVRFQCPNCHSQTETWCNGHCAELTSLAIYNREFRKKKRNEKALKNQAREPKPRKSKPKGDPNWRSKPKDNQRRAIRPDYETLKSEIEQTNWSAVGRKYGVSDNAIRKWIKMYEKYGDDYGNVVKSVNTTDLGST